MRDIFEEFARMHREIDRLFGSAFGGQPLLLGAGDKPVKLPETDLEDTGKELIASFDLPGVEKGDIHLSVDKDSIAVKAERKAEKKEEKKGYYRHERSYSTFSRSFALPAEVIPEQAEAEYKDGVLTVKMPKKVITQEKRRLIEVKVK